MSAALLKFPDRDIRDVGRALRALADWIDGGECGEAHNVAWVIDCGDGRIDLGMAGAAAEPGITCHYLLALGMRRLEAGST